MFHFLLLLLPASFLILLVPLLAYISLVIALAACGASLGIRKMYVKGLLKIFEYATNIKQEKIKDCEELIETNTKTPMTQLERKQELAKLHRKRQESFMLNPPPTEDKSTSDSSDDIDEEQLNEADKENNNYLPSSKNKLPSSATRELRSRTANSKLSTISDTSAYSTAVNTDDPSLNEIKRKDTPNGHVRDRKTSENKRDFQLGDIVEFVQKGIETIIDDDVTKRFTTEELTVWNLLSRTNQQYEYVSFRVTVLWMFGLILRYLVLFPFRMLLFLVACSYTFISTFLIGLLKEGPFKRYLNWYATMILHRILSRVFSAIITFHNREYRAKPGSICVANHTSPIDVIILSTDNCYSMIGQEHGGFTGMMQKAFSRASKHIWFDRSAARDRGLVAKRMREHVNDKTNMPILIFPEGTCINNTSVMMFKKGCFEVDTTIYPVAIKYDLRFGDAFWNSNKHSMLQYLMLMMTSWAIVVDVYYLPPMEKNDDEDAADFASRVKCEIVKKGSFVNLEWDGMLKRTAPKLDLMYKQQKKYVSRLKLE